MGRISCPEFITGFIFQQWQKTKEQPLTFFIAAHTILFLVVFIAINSNAQPAEFERSIALKMLNGQLPYRDFSVEYPPLALLSFLLPALIAQNSPVYSWYFAIEMLIADIVILILLSAITSRMKKTGWEILGVYTLCLISIGALVTNRFDMLPGMLLIAALYAFVMKKSTTAWALIGLGIMTKAFPAVVAPLFALYHLRTAEYRKLIYGILALSAVVVVLSLPWLLMNAQGYMDFLLYHAERGLHSESTYASLILMQTIMGINNVRGEMTFGSWNIDSPVADTLAKASPIITIGLLLILYVLFAYNLWEKTELYKKPGDMDNGLISIIFRYSALAVMIFLLTSKVFSPQFLIWLCPLVALSKPRFPAIFWTLFIIAGGLTQYIFPYHYLSFEIWRPLDVSIMAARNFLLVVMAVWLVLPFKIPEMRSDLITARSPVQRFLDENI